ncbi:hypothetical protein [Palleronia rufa]|uniref:hypothetical protein n=1 Tax=Palleronia rufa TaxID=1530186 RepID=UPI0005617C68|nr:hypothetical protein [Palleronia rufa]
MKRIALIALLAATPAAAHEYGFAGILSNTNKADMPGLTLSVGTPIADGPITLKSGTMYELEIAADGSGELALEAPGFFRAIWVNEVVVNGLEIRPFGLESVEFDQAGTMEIEFLAIRPGQYEIRIPGARGDSQRVSVTIQ